MNLNLYQKDVFDAYKSNSQRIRVLTEHWMDNNMFCPACLNPRISPFPNNMPVADFFCPNCNEQFQLKSQKTMFSKRILDGAYHKMIESVQKNLRPNFFLLQYDLDYIIENLALIPHFFFIESAIEKRHITYPKGRKNGWVGCNILLNKIPPEGVIKIIEDKGVQNRNLIFSQWKKISFIKDKTLSERGWTVDILRIVHSIDKKEFALSDVYEYEEELAKDYPNNNYIKAKIRQQLQILRDKGILKFKERGRYLAVR